MEHQVARYANYQFMGWLRLVGSLKSQASFAEHSLFYRALLQKRLLILRSLLVVATPYLQVTCSTRMGWLRSVGSLKLYVSFAEYSLFYRALLQKRPVLLRSLPIVATAYPECNGSCCTLYLFIEHFPHGH